MRSILRHLPTIVGALLGLLFVTFGMLFFLQMLPSPPPSPEGSWPALFMGAFFPSGYLDFVKVLEVIGGVLVAIPKTRNLGLLVLGPIIINILAFHALIMKGEGMLNPILGFIVVAALYLLWVERKAFAGLVHRPGSPDDAHAA